MNREAKGDKDRWEAINVQLRGGGLAGMLHELKRRDITGWHPRDSIPQTQALVEQKLLE